MTIIKIWHWHLFSHLYCLFRFSSEIGDRRSRCFDNVGSSTSSSSGKSRNISESLDSNEIDNQVASGRDGLIRSRWTSSFRRLLGRKSKSKLDRSSGTSKTDETQWIICTETKTRYISRPPSFSKPLRKNSVLNLKWSKIFENWLNFFHRKMLKLSRIPFK